MPFLNWHVNLQIGPLFVAVDKFLTLLHELRKEDRIFCEGRTSVARWFAAEKAAQPDT